MKYLKLYEDIDLFDDDEWDFDEEDDGLEDGDYVIFLPNPHHTQHNNFAIRKVLFVKNRYIIIEGDFGESFNSRIIPTKHNIYYKKLYTKNSWDLKSGDFFFDKEDNEDHHHVYIVDNIKMGGVICDLQPLNYAGGMVEERKLVLHGKILVPDEETKKDIQKKIDRIKKGR